jgi:hypothetical protein
MTNLIYIPVPMSGFSSASTIAIGIVINSEHNTAISLKKVPFFIFESKQSQPKSL